MEVFVTNITGLKIFVFIDDMIFAFTTFVTNTPLWGKKSEKNILQISHLFFDLLFYFHFLPPSSSTKKNDAQGWNFHLKHLDVEKMVGSENGKLQNP